MRLEIFPHQLQQDLPACFTFKNNDGLDFHMRIRRTPSSTTLEDADENPLEGLQTRFGNRWHPLSKWIEGRYRKQTLNETSANQVRMLNVNIGSSTDSPLGGEQSCSDVSSQGATQQPTRLTSYNLSRSFISCCDKGWLVLWPRCCRHG